MGQVSLRKFVGDLWLPALLVAATAMACAFLSGSALGQSADSPFTMYSGSEFFEESNKFDVPYEPTPIPVVNAMLMMASVGPNDFLIDLGSGDGRIVITAAKKYRVHGFGVDLNEKLVQLSKQYAQDEGVADRIAFRVQDIFSADISKADVVTMYLLPEVNLKLRSKLLSDLRPGTRVVSHDFHMGEWRPDKTTVMDSNKWDRDDSVLYLWIIPAKVAGKWRWSLPLRGEKTFDAKLTQDYQDIGGVVANEKGTLRLFNTDLRGDRVSFSLVSEVNSRLVRQDYEGRINGNVIEGTVKLSGGITETHLKWRALRTETPAGGASP